MNKLLPDYTTPEELAAHLGINARTLRELARRLGACSELGKRMILRADDVSIIMEATRPCPSKSSSAETSGTMQARLPEGGYAGLVELRKKQSRSASRPSAKQKPGNVISMARARP